MYAHEKILLTLTLGLISLAAAKAQNLGYVEGLFSELLIPYSVVITFDTAGAPDGQLQPDANGIQEAIGFYASNGTYQLIEGKAYGTASTNNPSPTNWVLVNNGQAGIVDSVGQQSGQNVAIKIKGAGGIKPVQIRSDGNRIMLFGSDGYVYHFNIASAIINGDLYLFFGPGTGSN